MQIIQHVLTVRDQAAGTYKRPFCEDSVGLAMRGMQTAIDDENSQIAKFPEDFEMYYLGTYNQATGLHDLLQIPLPIMNGKTGPRVNPEEFIRDLAATRETVLAEINKGSLLEEVG